MDADKNSAHCSCLIGVHLRLTAANWHLRSLSRNFSYRRFRPLDDERWSASIDVQCHLFLLLRTTVRPNHLFAAGMNQSGDFARAHHRLVRIAL